MKNLKNFKAFHQMVRIGKLGFSITIPVMLLWLALYSLPESPAVQAASLRFPSSQVVTHTAATGHQMRVFGDGKISDQFRSDDDPDFTNQIDRLGDDITATTIAISFDQHGGAVDVGVQDEFTVITPITLISSSSPGFIEETIAVYGGTDSAYRIIQRTLAAATNKYCVIMELIIENTDNEPLTGGKLLFMVDIDVAEAAVEDIGRYDPVNNLLYQKDDVGGVGYAMGMALLEGDLTGYNVLTDAHAHFPDFGNGNDPDLTAHLMDPNLPFTSAPAGAGENLVSWLVAAIPDISVGETETLVFGLCARSGVSQDDAEAALIEAFGDTAPAPQPDVAFDQEMYEVNESDGAATITVALSHPFRRPVSVDYATVTGGTATPDSDYVTAAGTLTFPPLVTTASFTVPILSDSIDEYDETVDLKLTGSVGDPIFATLTITDDDPVPTLSINAEPVHVDEEPPHGESHAVFEVTLSSSSEKEIEFHYETVEGTADAGDDYTFVAGNRRWHPGLRIAIPIITDNIDEDNETFFVQLSSVTNADPVITQGEAVIIDNDTASLSIIAGPPVIEGDDGETVPAVFTVSLAAASEQTITVDYETGDDTATVADEDYTTTHGTLTFAPQTVVQSITVPVKGDNDDEAYEEIFSVVLTNPNRDILLEKSQATGVIRDDDATISIEGAEAPEGAAFVFTVTLSNPNATDVIVSYSITDDTATAPSDYITKEGTLIFPAGDNTPQSISVTVEDDELDENDTETFFVNLRYDELGAAQGVGTIVDNDTTDFIIDIDDDNGHIDEGNGEVRFIVTLSKPSIRDIIVEFRTQDRTAKAKHNDYITMTKILTFPAHTLISIPVSVTLIDDSKYEGDETFFVELVDPVNDDKKVTRFVTILDNDSEPTISISDAVPVLEKDGGDEVSAVFEVSLAGPSAREVRVKYHTTEGTATANKDYKNVDKVIEFSSGETEKSITVMIKGDNIDEENENFFVDLSNPVNAKLDGKRGIGTILDNDPEPTISISDAAPVLEKDGGDEVSAVFEVSLSGPSEKGVSVRYSTEEGAATADLDYESAQNVPLPFPNGVTTQRIHVPIIGDLIDEGDGEDFFVVLHDPSKASPGDLKGSGRIIDDDPKMVYLPLTLRNYLPPPICIDLVEDGFDTQKGWITDGVVYSYVPPPPSSKEYNIKPEPGKNASSLSPFGSFSQYSVKVDARWADGAPGAWYGILFGIRGQPDQRVTQIDPEDHLYRFIVDTKGDNPKFAVQIFDPDVNPSQWFDVVGWTPASAINKGASSNTLEVRCYNQSKVVVYANNRLLWMDKVSATCDGQVGIRSHLASSNITANARFDNFRICGQKISGASSISDDDRNSVPKVLIPVD